ncbi:hypothetical protein N7448_000396 [Penicillium atrosanguineum]|uniref:Uncharacterized protein n=1 Tax=Penicillium atrosanguineum TaxID=1132637 RepID=A0A9W9HGX8_9EURO|nr:hypothetical protein N7526_005950 [Penicillium atrosanguineum]KAJ5148818.1 hypothetical protein N7448_000396 [Penicillium atrosanguineum]KAJ5323609.1 hypothetical protein N7476_002209 [Penicillium atrosanguineum]
MPSTQTTSGLPKQNEFCIRIAATAIFDRHIWLRGTTENDSQDYDDYSHPNSHVQWNIPLPTLSIHIDTRAKKSAHYILPAGTDRKMQFHLTITVIKTNLTVTSQQILRQRKFMRSPRREMKWRAASAIDYIGLSTVRKKRRRELESVHDSYLKCRSPYPIHST